MPIVFHFGDPILEAWDILHHTYDSISKCEGNQFAKNGIPFQQFHVLLSISSAIKYHDGPVTLTVLANWLDRHPNSITSMIDRLEKASLVRRVKDLADRRAYRLDLTPDGKEEVRRGNKCLFKLPERIYSILSDEELTLFINLLTKIRDNTYEIRKVKDKVTEIKCTQEF